jgi:16S rRNA (cytidine1402-2'-O)-methyltransferase
MIFYESVHRIEKTIEQFIEYFGIDRRASVSRELTKVFEETMNGTLGEISEKLKSGTIKGEFVIVVEGKK